MKSSLLEHYKKKYGTGGKIPIRKTGMWYQDGDVVVPSNEITMEGPNGEKDYFDSPIMGIGLQSGKSQVMLPGENYFFPEDDAVLEKKMQKGAKFKSSLDSVSPQGNINYGVSGSLGPVRGRLSADTDVYNPKATSIAPSLSVGDFNLDYSPEMLKLSYEGNKVRGSVNRTPDKKTEAELSLMLDKLNFDTSASLDKESLQNIRASANYRLAPNLSLYGNVNYTPNKPAEYGVGFNYRKQFSDGGQSKKFQKAGFIYTPPPRRAFTTSYPQPVRSTSDNARVVTHNTNVSDASRTKIMAQRAEEQRRKEQEARRKAQEPIRSTSDNTRLVTANTNVSDATRAMIDDQRAKEAAAKRSGVIYATPEESNYEKAKKAASFVEQSKLSDGFATPLDYVLDVVNPAQYVFGAGDLAMNQLSMMKNVAQGNFSEALSDYQEAQMNALTLAPASKYLGPVLKGAANYGDDIIKTSKAMGKLSLPKYKDVYRAEHAAFNQLATPQDITGRWAANSADETSYYVQNLKDPTTGNVINAFSGEQAPVRIMKQRLPEYKYNQLFGEGMPEAAKILSQGPGKMTANQLDNLLGPGAAKRFNTQTFLPSDLAALETAPFLYNTNEGILDPSIINQLRSGQSAFRGSSSLFSNQAEALDYLKLQSKSKNIADPLNKYLPFNTFQMGGMSIPGINGTVVSAMPTTIRESYNKRKKK